VTTRKTVRARCAALLRPEGANPMGWRLLRHVDDAREGLVVHELPAGIATARKLLVTLNAMIATGQKYVPNAAI
jgi:hypothetical protein